MSETSDSDKELNSDGSDCHTSAESANADSLITSDSMSDSDDLHPNHTNHISYDPFGDTSDELIERSDSEMSDDLMDLCVYTDLVDSTGDQNRFRVQFEELYGTVHPVFFRGSYTQAIDEAKRDLKFLLVYLHSDPHEDTQEFCRSVITNQQFIDFLTQNNIIFWSSSVAHSDGYRVSLQLRESTYPFLALIGLKHNRMVVIRKFEGKTTLETLLTQLRVTIDQNESSLIVARQEREERNMNQMIRQQQDEAFAESLKADQEKERRKEEERIKREAEEKAKKDKELAETDRKNKLLKLRDELVAQIPPEPESADPNATKLVIKLPNGTRLERRFLKTQSIRYLYYWVFSNPQSPLHFQIRTNFPPRDLPGKPPQPEHFATNGSVVNNVGTSSEAPTFEECDLGKGAMLFVHDLEA